MKADFPFHYVIYKELNSDLFLYSWRRGDSIEIDMTHYSSAIVINVSLILGEVKFTGDLDKTEFNRTEAHEITTIPSRRILFYAEQPGLLKSIKKPGRGKGRKYSRQDIAELLLIRELARRGVTISEMRGMVRNFRDDKPYWWDSRKQDYKRA
jgi:hypothetical protein